MPASLRGVVRFFAYTRNGPNSQGQPPHSAIPFRGTGRHASLAWPLAASDVAAGETIIATPRHEKLALDSMARLLLPLLDGSRTRADLVAQVLSLAQGGAMQVRDASGALIVDEERLRDIAAKSVDGCLRGLAQAGVLVA